MDTSAAVLEAREAFLSGMLTDVDSLTAQGVRPEIAASWRRSRLHGLSPALALPRGPQGGDADGQFMRAAESVVESRRSTLADLDAGITLTDQEGRLLRRWVESPRFARRLDARHVLVGTSIGEDAVGTCSSGIAVEMRRPVMVVGPEHFADGAINMTTVGAPIHHPVTRKLVGAINYTCDVDDTHTLLLPWVQRLATEIEEALLHAVSRNQRVLLDAYLTSGVDARHPVVCMDDHTLITNAAAARMLGTADQAMLWEMASRRIASPVSSGTAATMRLESDQRVKVDVTVVESGARAIGALLRLTPIASQRSPRPVTDIQARRCERGELDRLRGHSAAWTGWCEVVRSAAAADAPILLWGEAGTGKTATARAIAADTGDGRPVHELDAALHGANWVNELTDALAGSADGGHVILRRLDLLNRAAAVATVRLLGGATARVISTVMSELPPNEESHLATALASWPGPTLISPPLRDRLEDLPELLVALAIDISGRSPRWPGEVVQTLGRQSWPANLHSLLAAVRAVLSRQQGPEVGLRHLPSYISAGGARRTLSGLESVEAHALVAALQAAGGNKREAANKLGIARSTLYRKVRALGLDLSAATY